MLPRGALSATATLLSILGAAANASNSRVRFSPDGGGLGAPQPYAFGSGAYGEWRADDVGAPTYAYTLDQIDNPALA